VIDAILHLTNGDLPSGGRRERNRKLPRTCRFRAFSHYKNILDRSTVDNVLDSIPSRIIDIVFATGSSSKSYARKCRLDRGRLDTALPVVADSNGAKRARMLGHLSRWIDSTGLRPLGGGGRAAQRNTRQF
jgi:hypothetical protein